MTTRIRYFLLVLFLFILIPVLIQAETRTVSNAAEFQTALNDFAQSPEDDIINLPGGTLSISETLYYPVPSFLSGGPGSLTIQGPSPTNRTVLDGDGTCTILNLDYNYNSGTFNDIGTTLTIRNINFQDGNYQEIGYQTYTGGVYINVDASNVVIEDCVFSNNQSSAGGAGGLYVITYNYNIPGTVSINGCTFTGNGAHGDYGAGGATIDTVGPVTVTDCTFGNNLLDEASYDDGAGGLYLYSDGDVDFSNNIFTGNTVHENHDDCAGGAYIDAYGAVTFENNTFSSNSADESGGAYIISHSDTVTVSRNTFTQNSALDGSGGGLYVESSEGILSSNTFSGNTAFYDGGAAYVSGPATIVNNLFLNNSAAGNPSPSSEYYTGTGGALYFNSSTSTTITNNTFLGNSAYYGAAVYGMCGLTSGQVANVYNNIFWDNTTTPVAGSTLENAADLLSVCFGSNSYTVNLFNNDYTAAFIEVIEGATLNEEDNITVNPQLDGVTARLTSLSPCIEMGLNTAPGLAGVVSDIDGDPRIADNDGDTEAIIDMGADEYVGVLVYHDLSASVSGDNGSVSPTSRTFVEGSVVTLTAVPDENYQVASWSGTDDDSSTSNINYVTMDSDKTVTVAFELIPVPTYTITASAGAGGSIDPDGITTLNEGASQTYTITPDTGYHIVDVLVDSSSIGAVSSHLFENVTAIHTISATFAINTYTIETTSGPGGSINPSSDQTVNYGDSVTFSILPGPTYDIADVVVDGSSVGAVSSYEFTNITADHEISVTFSIKTFTITLIEGENGTVSPAGNVVLDFGSNQEFIFTPDTHYHIADVILDGTSLGSQDSYQISNVQDDHTLEVVFAIDTFTITANATVGGSIDPDGNTIVAHGGSLSFAISADTDNGYHLVEVTVDGSSVGAVSNYEFENITADHTINATFALDTFTITASAGAGGSILPGSVTAIYDSDRTFTITPNTGYHIVDVLVDSVSQGAVTSYLFENITAVHTISATFAIDTFTITSTAGDHGSISPASATVNYGGSQSFTIIPETGYYVAEVLVDSVSVGAVTSYLFENITENQTISATFAEIPPDQYVLNATTIGSGTVTLDPATGPYDDGTEVSLTAVPAAGWQFDGWGGDLSGSTNPATITMDSNKSVNATFSLTTFTITASAGQGGSISPANATVTYGGSQTFTITPDTHYHVSDVFADGSSVGAISSYTFTNVTADYTISATFAIDTHTLTLTPPENGSVVISPDLAEYTYGSVVQLLATPDEDYMFDGWSGDVAESDAAETTVLMDSDKTVAAVFVPDEDNDGVPTDEEQGPDGTDTSYDGNNDGETDAAQSNVVSGHAYNDEYITLASPTDTAIVGTDVEELPESVPEEFDFPYGLISFAIDNVTPAGSTTVEIYLPEGETCDTYYKYDEMNDTWEEFLYDESTGTGAVIEDNVITLHFVDGQRGDQDGIADGIITDPGTPGVAIPEEVPDSGDDDEWYACFISTAGNHTDMKPFFAFFILFISAALLSAMRSSQKR